MSEIVAIIGAGPSGRRLALASARGGFAVRLEDLMPQNLEQAQEWIHRELGAESAALSVVSTIEDAVREADLAIDCVPDELESKLEMFCLLDRMAPPKTVLATPTTQMSIADLASCTYRPDKCIAIAHDPAHLAELSNGEVQLVTTSGTSGETIALVDRFWSRLGLRPIFTADPREMQSSRR